jgi:hypothetical protein
LASCASDNDCDSNHYCAANNTCQARMARGATCNPAAGADCLVAGCRDCAASTGGCRFGFCCNTTCNNGSPSSCTGGTETDYACGGGTCTMTPKSCSPYTICNGSVCATTCALNSDCASLYWCAAAGTTPNPGATAACIADYTTSGTACRDADCVNAGCLQCDTGPTAPNPCQPNHTCP